MRYIERGPEPEILRANRNSKKSWQEIVIQANAGPEIKQQLLQMQKNLCAYCEIDLEHKKSHIEHFFQQSRHPELRFSWENLFASCNFLDSCGKYKDQNVDDIDLCQVCKPDSDDPERFLLFLASGKVRTRMDLDKAEQKIALNTIAVFHLNAPRLVNDRKSHMAIIRGELEQYLGYKQEIKSLSAEDIELLNEFRTEAMQRVAEGSYPTALKHIWQGAG